MAMSTPSELFALRRTCDGFPAISPRRVAVSAMVCRDFSYPKKEFQGAAPSVNCRLLPNAWRFCKRQLQCSSMQGWAAIATTSDPSSQETQSSKKVVILNPTGLKLVGIFDEGGSKELSILCHGFRSSKASSTLGSLSNALVEAGISTFRFDFSGNGESEGDFAYGNYWREVEDLRAVVNHWNSNGRRVVSVIGHSKGGNAVVLYASKFGDVSTIINISGRFDLEAGIGERLGGEEGLRKVEEEGVIVVRDKAGNVEYRVTKESLQERLSTDMHTACLAIPEHCQVVTIHGAVDKTVPVEDAHEFAKRIPTHALAIVEGADHNYRYHQHELANLVLKFVQSSFTRSRTSTEAVAAATYYTRH